MPRLDPLPMEALPEDMAERMRQAQDFMGFTPNDALTMARVPELMGAMSQLVGAAYGPGTLGIELKRLLAIVVSSAAGCQYCAAHTGHGAHAAGIDQAKLDGVWEFETSPLFSEAERAARMLGRPFTVRGRVTQGDQRGHSIGFPTANLDPENEVLPAPGVYAGHLRMIDDGDPASGTTLPAVTNVATSRLARLSEAPVLPFFPERMEDGRGYRILIGAPLEDFPGEDPVADAIRFNRLIEARIRAVPHQYLWVHRRFKKRPGELEDVYADV